MNVLVLNCGSSTVKFQVIQTDLDLIAANQDRSLAGGVLERIGSQSLVSMHATGQPPYKTALPIKDHTAAIDSILRWVISPDSKIDHIRTQADIHGIGHRVVHGGEKFVKSVRIDDQVMMGLNDCIQLAPLHNPANIKGIKAAQELMGPGVPQVAVFDTAFHSTLPETSYLYAIPYQYYRRFGIRRYGFHGTSHRYVAYRYRQLRGLEREQVNIISLHLGNGCSACAIKGGRSMDTSMGFTPLEGLVIGTRSGDLDPSVIEYLHHQEGMSIQEIDMMLNKQSGLLGVSGLTSDMRELLAEEAENQDRRARLAIDIFCSRIRKYIGAYMAEMGGADAVVFTGGIGQNAWQIRDRICKGIECLGLKLDPVLNQGVPEEGGCISSSGSTLQAWMIPTNEELLIARDTFRTIQGVPSPSGF